MILKWIWVIPLLIAFAFGFSTYDYGWRCTKCLRQYHVVEERFAGLTYHRTEKLQFEGNELTLIQGAHCQHVYRKDGFGESYLGSIGCGMTAEGNLFRGRWTTLQEAFRLYGEIPNQDLMLKTLQFADATLPADTTVREANKPGMVYLFLLGNRLQSAKSEQEWAGALQEIKEVMAKENAAR